MEADRDAVIELWRRCDLVRAWNDPHRDIDRKLARDPDLLLVGERDRVVVAAVMVGYDGHRGWVNYLAVDPDGIAWWEVVGSIAVLATSIWLAIRIGARLFRVGFLLTGNRPPLADLWRQSR